MNRLFRFAAVLLWIVPAAAFESFSQDVAPAEPEIVLPSVLLEIEDLSVESVTAVFPEEEEGIPPFLEFPPPGDEGIYIAEPAIDLAPPASAASKNGKGQVKDFSAEAELGLGTMNHLFSRVSLFSLGGKPEGKLLFQHETLDGLSGNDPGKGYSRRSDLLDGSLKIRGERATVSTEGAFMEFERGLQGDGAFYSKINRNARIGGAVLFTPDERFSLDGSLGAAAAAQLLTGSGGPGPREIDEYLVFPSVAAEYHFEKGTLGFSPRFSYRGVRNRDDLSTGRVEARAYAGFDFNDLYRFDGGIGWFWGGTTGHLFPFDLGIGGRFSDVLTLSVRGGFKVEEVNLYDLFSAYHLMGFPGELDDNYGWFFETRGGWIAMQGLTLDVGVSFRDNSKMPTFDAVADATTGLFPFRQVEALRVRSDLGVRWSPSEVFSARAGWEWELADKPAFSPRHRFTLEGTAAQKRGRFGGGVTFEQLLGVNSGAGVPDQAPVVGANGFIQANDFMRFTLEANDLLYPFLDGPRYDWYPFVDAGFTLTLKCLVTF